MLDSGLAELYEVETKILNQAVRRNIDRFPNDFCFECNSGELEDLRSQFVTAKMANLWNYKRRGNLMSFTENGVAMLSSVLNSPRAIQVNISIMRIFTKLRSYHLMENDLIKRMDRLESGSQKIFKIVFERLDTLENEADNFKPDPAKKKIGL